MVISRMNKQRCRREGSYALSYWWYNIDGWISYWDRIIGYQLWLVGTNIRFNDYLEGTMTINILFGMKQYNNCSFI